ncbi:orotate phosphoribosyltransferase [Helicobacter ailurogastricus]|uniref:orotate phosphoribosyltransferase n=1 Tax=Helicobacter ailurogastricus TaxID=1578720 RepID=UPI00244D81B8|nr:orotate phosphoribosyltransferase [Helicobacter ailurogastricus]GMB91101.1 Orotate phosphoribosyltransferase PyrE [Helicobacter ailurogastricus]
MDIRKIYTDCGALLEGHFLLSSGNHSNFYLQSAKVLEDPATASKLAHALATEIQKSNLEINTICAPALGGILAGYELARALGVRFIFTERVQGAMCLRRGFSVQKGEKILVCEDIITTGGSAMESAACVESLGAQVMGFASLANRGICQRGLKPAHKEACKLPNLPFFALADFNFDMYAPENCPLCAHSQAIKPGSRGN